MANHIWIGATAPVAQVTAWVFAGTWESTDVITITIGSNVKSVVAGSTTITTIIDTIVTALAALDPVAYPEFAEITFTRSSTSLVGTAAVSGVPFTCTVATTETGGGAADAQTIDGAASSTGTDSTACTGPNFYSAAGNWSGGVPVDGGDVIIANSSVSILYGLAQSGVTPASLRIDASFTGKIGLPLYNDNGGYYEYRARYLAVGNSGDGGNVSVLIGRGDGAGSQRMHLDFGTGQMTTTVYQTGQPIGDGEPALFIKGTHTSNVLNVQKGFVGLAYYPGEASALATLRIGFIDNVDSDAVVSLGAGVTACTTCEKSGGRLYSEGPIATLTQIAGETVMDAGAMTTCDVRGGTVYWNSTSTLATAVVSGEGHFDCSRDMRAKTITNPINRYGDRSRITDPFKVISSLVVDLEYSGPNLEPLNLGTHLKLTRATPT